MRVTLLIPSFSSGKLAFSQAVWRNSWREQVSRSTSLSGALSNESSGNTWRVRGSGPGVNFRRSQATALGTLLIRQTVFSTLWER